MASVLSASTEGEDPSKVAFLKDALYQAVVENGSETRLWGQKDLEALDVVPEGNMTMLLRVIQGLCNDNLFKAMSDGRLGLCWRYRTQEEARKFKHLNQDQRLVYEQIEDADADGIWSRTLKTRLNMHESVLKQCLKQLEAKGYIRDMKSVENPNKKMYIKATLRPSERATGGPWYTDSSLDEAFIADLERLVFDTVKNRSSYLSTHGGAVGNTTSSLRQPKKGVIRGDGTPTPTTTTTTTSTSKKRTADAISADDPTPRHNTSKHRRPSHSHSRREVLLPLPAGYTDYPTVRQIAELIEKSGVTNNTTLGEADIQQLVDVLVHDGLIEPVPLHGSRGGRGGRGEMGYRAVNIARLDPTPLAALMALEDGANDPDRPPPRMGAPPIDSGLTETPCGLCPVFELCEEGGPVSPSNCVYFNRWLGLDTGAVTNGGGAATPSDNKAVAMEI